MMKYRFTSLAMILLLLMDSVTPGLAQEQIQISTHFNIGDPVPDYTLTNLINYQSPTAKFSDFRGKLLILDFWNSHCAACLQSWPKLLHLQQEFQGKIQIVTIDDLENEAKVKQLFAKRNEIAGINMLLPTSCGDSSIEKIFPYSSVPYIIWIDENGNFKANTYGNSLTAQNIQDHFDKKVSDMLPALQNNELVSWAGDKPIFIDGNGDKPDSILGQSVFAKADIYLFPQMPHIDYSPDRSISYATGNACIRDLYGIAYGDKLRTTLGYKNIERPVLRGLLSNRIRLEVRDSSKYVDFINGNYRYDKHYLYQLISPTVPLKKMQEMMQADLNRFIGLHVQWKTIRKMCLVLSADKSFSQKPSSGPITGELDISHIHANNILMSSFIDALERNIPSIAGSYPLIDETKTTGRINEINIQGDITNIAKLDAALGQYGLHLKMRERPINILVLSEVKHRRDN